MTKEDSVPKYTSCRYVTAYVGFFGFFCVYAIRFNMSVAIVCMTHDPPGNQTSKTLPVNSSSTSECTDTRIKTNLTLGELEWDRETRSVVLSSFFWGYIVTQIPGGILSSYYGGKKVFAVGMIFSILATYLLPVAARASPIATIFLRFVMGLGTGVVFPAMHSIIARWAPLYEKSKLAVIAYSGTMIGTVVIFSSSGVLCENGFDGGWPSIFYVTALISTVWLVLWCVFVYDGPNEHPRISDRELNFIQQSIGRVTKPSLKETPWKSMFSSGALWGIVFAHMCNNLGAYTIMTLLPSYLDEVLKFNMKENGLYASLPYIAMFICGTVSGHLADFIRENGVRTVIVRKSFTTVSWIIAAAFLVSFTFIKCDHRMVAVAFVVIAASAMTFGGRGGYIVNHIDIAPRFAGIMLGISNTAATIPGILTPLLAGWIVKKGLREEWQILFFICGSGYIIGCILVLILMKGEVQEWAKEKNEEDHSGNLDQS